MGEERERKRKNKKEKKEIKIERCGKDTLETQREERRRDEKITVIEKYI